MNDLHRFPVFRSLLFPALFCGMPKKMFFAMATTSAAVVVGMGQLWFLPFALVCTAVLSLVSKQDIYFLEIYFDVIKLPEVMD